MTYPQSGSSVDQAIRMGLSTLVVVKIGSTTVGAIQELTINQTRDIVRWEEIGVDGIVDSHPRHATQVNLTINRLVFDQLRLPEAFSRGFINLQAQRFPFDIEVIDKFAGEDQLAVVHSYRSCWFNSYSTPYRATDYVITENASVFCEYATSMQNASAVPLGGVRGIPVEFDNIERNTDLTGQRGHFDSAGLTNLRSSEA